MLSIRFQLTERYLLRIRATFISRPQLRHDIVTAHKHQAENRQRKADGYIQPPIMADREFCLAIRPLGCAEEAHTEDAADEGGGQEKHRQDLNDAQRPAVLMGRACYLCGFGSHLDVHLKGGGGVSRTLLPSVGSGLTNLRVSLVDHCEALADANLGPLVVEIAVGANEFCFPEERAECLAELCAQVGFILRRGSCRR